ncbi:MAG: hypothetical protein ACI361_07925 [Atopobiaceae bacterium]
MKREERAAKAERHGEDARSSEERPAAAKAWAESLSEMEIG